LLRIAHRGYAAQGGENSLASIARALELGCDMVEIDVRRRRDGVLVLDHDNGDRPGAPELDAALRLIATSAAGVNLDVKQGETGPAIIDVVRDTGMLGRTTCTGGGWESLTRIHDVEPAIRIGLTLPRRGSTLPRIVQRLGIPVARHRMAEMIPVLRKRHDADLVTVHHRLVDRRVVEAAHRDGGQIWSWTVDDPRELRRLEELGVDGVCSDRPSSHGLG
jgi:glycerophosphoryl diester phosphodiesterase